MTVKLNGIFLFYFYLHNYLLTYLFVELKGRQLERYLSVLRTHLLI